MSANLVIDTNVLLLADTRASCLRIANMVMQKPEDYVLFLDKEGRIDHEYVSQLKIADGDESVIKLFVSWLIEREDKHQGHRLCSRVNGREIFKDTFRKYQQTAESSLIGISCGQTNTYLIVVEQSRAADEPIERCYRNDAWFREFCLSLDKTGNHLDVLQSSKHDQLNEIGEPNIASYNQLRAFLERNRRDTESVERKSIELKCPKHQELGSDLIEDVMEALCGMLNSLSGMGYIFIGVEDGATSGLRLKGIPRRFKDREKPSWDELKRDVMNRLCYFQPHQPNRIDFVVIQDQDDDLRGILAFYVHPDTKDRGYTYRNNRYVRIGESTRREHSA